MSEQGPIGEITIDKKLQEDVHSKIIEILRTIFAWFDMPWRELTYENMFDRAKDLKHIDKEQIRFSKFVPHG